MIEDQIGDQVRGVAERFGGLGMAGGQDDAQRLDHLGPTPGRMVAFQHLIVSDKISSGVSVRSRRAGCVSVRDSPRRPDSWPYHRPGGCPAAAASACQRSRSCPLVSLPSPLVAREG
jgi:hypothetical protein